MTNLDSLLILNAVAGFTPKRVRSLIAHFGNPSKVIRASKDDLLRFEDLPEHAVFNLQNFDKDKFLSREYALLESKNILVITMEDEGYPQALCEIDSSPVLLYVRGRADILNEPSVGIVGSRRASLYGMGVARQFAITLAESGMSIVSGLARGIDTAAHQGALQAGGFTIAVLGCGLDHVYPAENADLADRVAQNGAVVSEFSMETPPVSYNFPRRNRIISGLSKGVLVVEAALKSGALITSDFALEQGREVYAVPGQVGQLASQGSNRLIQQGAKLVLSADDILEDLAPGLKRLSPSQGQVPSVSCCDEQLSPDELRVCSSIESDPVHIDELADRSGLSIMQTTLNLFKLELKKLVRQLPGQRFEKMKAMKGHKITCEQEQKRAQV